MQYYPRNVRMVYHPFPFSEPGLAVARGLEAAGQQGKFWEMHDRLLNVSFSEMSDADVETELINVAEGLGLDVEGFKESLDSPAVKDRIDTAKQQAVARGVLRPGVYMDGKEVVFTPGIDLRSIIDKELKRLGG